MPAPPYRRFLPRRASEYELKTAAHTDYAPRRKRYYIRVPLRSGEEIGIGWSPDAPWLDVWARSRLGSDSRGHYTGRYREYGFAPSGDRWSYGQAPSGAREMRRIIYALFRPTAEGVELVDPAGERDRRWREGRRIEEGVNAAELGRMTQRPRSMPSPRKRVADEEGPSWWDVPRRRDRTRSDPGGPRLPRPGVGALPGGNGRAVGHEKLIGWIQIPELTARGDLARSLAPGCSRITRARRVATVGAEGRGTLGV